MGTRSLPALRAVFFHALALSLLGLTTVPAASQPATSPSGEAERFVPRGLTMKKAASTTRDLRTLPQTPPEKRERPEREEPRIVPTEIERRGPPPKIAAPRTPVTSAPAPAPSASFDGLDYAHWGFGHPPDPNGDVGPTYYIQAINASVGVFRKSDGVPVAAFNLNTFMSQGAFGNPCDTDNFGDPVVLYDTFEDRWVITDFAFKAADSVGIIDPPGAFQCLAVSKTGDPVSGGWNFYSMSTTVAGGSGLADYPKFGIWPDGLYMAANMYGYPVWSGYESPRAWAFNKAQMYAGQPTVQIVTFVGPALGDFTLLPSNARLQAGTPPSGTPNYFISTTRYINALAVYKFHVDWDSISLSTFTGPDTPLAGSSWTTTSALYAPSLGGVNLDTVPLRAMMQNQYSNIGGVESLWAVHTVRRTDTSDFATPRWYQADVTGGNVGWSLLQGATWDPDGADVMHRFVPSLAVDRAGDLALGYSTSSSTTKPAIKYAGRLTGDPLNTLGQTEQVLIQGAGTQDNSLCGGAACPRWGDYSSMTLDPDGCTFWYTNEYYAVDGWLFQTRIGSFAYPSCTKVGNGGVRGTVTGAAGGAPIASAAIAMGTRTTTTDATGKYSFPNVPAGTYPRITANAAGYNHATVSNLVVTNGGTAVQDFSLGTAPSSACLTDTTQADLQAGTQSNVDLTTSPGMVLLLRPSVDQQNTTFGKYSIAITSTDWGGQTFTPAVSGKLTKADISLYCVGCSGTTPDLTVSVRATSGGVPSGPDLASATIGGFSSNKITYYTAVFGAPPALTAGSAYALLVRPSADPSAGLYAMTRTGAATLGASMYAAGDLVTGAGGGTSWSVVYIGGEPVDAGFRTYMDSGYVAVGTQVSSLKDANPVVGGTAEWTTLSWHATTPPGTLLGFQVAASNSPEGPFLFVGPDGTSWTFFTTSPASLAQFNGYRYLKYLVLLNTTDPSVTPAVGDVTVCFCAVPPAPTITPGGPTTFCDGGSVTLTSSSPSGNQWYRSGLLILGATNRTFVATVSGDYRVTASDGGCTSPSSAATTVVVDPLPATPTITSRGPTTFCHGDSVTLNSSGPSGNQWYRNGFLLVGATGSAYVATTSGAYAVTVTASGCRSASSAPTVVTVDPPPAEPAAFTTSSATVCPGQSNVMYTVPNDPTVTYTWSYAGGTGATISGTGNSVTVSFAANATSGTLSVTANGSCGTSAARTLGITVDPTPAQPGAFTTSTPTICLDPNGSPTDARYVVPNDSAVTYTWSYTGTGATITGRGNSVTVSFSSAATSGTLSVTASNGCGTSAARTIRVTVGHAPSTATAGGAQTICPNGSTTGLGANTPTHGSGQWSVVSGGTGTFSPSATTPNATFTHMSGSGPITLRWTIESPPCPSSSTDVIVSIAPPPSAAISGGATVCAGQTASLTVTLTGGTPPFSVVVNGTTYDLVTSPGNISVSPTATTNYTISSVTAGGCTNTGGGSGVATVTVVPDPQATISGDTAICTGRTAGLMVSLTSGTPPFSVVVNGKTYDLASSPATITVHPVDTTTYTISSVSAGGCTNPAGGSGSATVTVPKALCVDDVPGDARFRADVIWFTTQGGNDGLPHAANPIPTGGVGVRRGGLFWFFAPDNPEMLLKVLNGCGVNGKFWVFTSAGTNVGLTTTVTDTQTSAARVYTNPDMTPAEPVQDIEAFACGAALTAEEPKQARPAPAGAPVASPPTPQSSPLAIQGSCAASSTNLCIDDSPGDRRFGVAVQFNTVQRGGRRGLGNAISTSALGVTRGGLVWFFDQDNPEMLVKVLNGCSLNGKYWVFTAATTNVGLTTTVTDTVTGTVKTYTNPDVNPAAPVVDVTAFGCD